MRFVFDTLVAEHRTTMSMLAGVSALPPTEVLARRAAFAELARLIRAHARAEEDIVFPALDGSHELGHHVRLDRREHQVIEGLLREVDATPVSSPDWARKLRLLADHLQRHIDDEEEVVFPRARMVISDHRARDLLVMYEAERDLVLAQLSR